MGVLPPVSEPSDCWQLVGPDDAATPPSVARLLNATLTRSEWRRAGLPVLFDEAGEVRHVQRGGRLYRFVPVQQLAVAVAAAAVEAQAAAHAP